MADSNGSNQPGSEAGEPAATRPRQASVASRISYKARSMSKDFEESNPPSGFMTATSKFASSAIVGDLPRRNSTNSSLGQPPTRRQTLTDPSTEQVPRESAEIRHHDQKEGGKANKATDTITSTAGTSRSAEKDASQAGSDSTAVAMTKEQSADTAEPTEAFDNGYHFPPSYPKGEAFKYGLMSFLRYCMTPVGFCVVLYGLNVVAWGGMLFLLLCNASPAMCYPDCNDINSPRRVWIEYDSQILTALFSLTAFGLAPWRFRDLFYLMKYRLMSRQDALRRLAGIHSDWFRLPGSAGLASDVGPENVEALIAQGEVPEVVTPLPAKKMAHPPLTGIRAPPTKIWKMDFVIWMNVWNTFFQCVLSGVMWGMNRFDRPSWSTGLFVALGCIVAGVGGAMIFVEGKHVKSIEGVPLTDRDRERLARDRELGIPHYNNIKDKAPGKDKKEAEKVKEKEKNKDVEKAAS